MDEDNDYEESGEDMNKEDDNDHSISLRRPMKINNFMWPWSRHNLICMILHKPVAMNKRDAL